MHAREPEVCVISTRVTVTKPSRGSLRLEAIIRATCSRISSVAAAPAVPSENSRLIDEQHIARGRRLAGDADSVDSRWPWSVLTDTTATRRPLPEVLVLDLGDGHVVPVARAGFEVGSAARCP